MISDTSLNTSEIRRLLGDNTEIESKLSIEYDSYDVSFIPKKSKEFK